MPESPNTLHSGQSDDAQNVSKWARRYAQNRSLGMIVSLVLFSLVYCAIGGMSYLAGQAYRSENMPEFAVWLVLLVFALAANIYLAVPRWGRELMERVTNRLYAQEGQVTISAPARIRQRWMVLLGLCFVSCVLASVALGDRIPIEYRQPVAALYLVPFLIFLNILQRPATSFVGLLWPFLIGLHAVLIVAGVPIVFTGRWDFLNIMLPVFGYGLLSGIVIHLYSRVALSRLKKLAHRNESEHSSADEYVSNPDYS